MSDLIRRAEATANKEVQPSERPPPRVPYDEPATSTKGTGRTDVSTRTDVSSNRADVRVVTDSRDRAHVNVDTHEGGADGAKWPRDAEEWKRLLAKAAPWLAAAALIAAGVRTYKQKDGESVENKARRAGRAVKNAADDAAEGAEHGWFGLKRHTNEAVDSAGNKAHDAKVAAGKKAEEAKETARNVADQAKHAARDTVDSAKRGVSNAANNVREGAEGAADKAASKADHGFFMWKSATRGVREKYYAAKQEAGHLAGEAVDAAKHGGQAVVDGARRAEHAAEGVLSKGAAKAGVAEEKTGRAMQEAGKRVEKAGHDTRTKYGDVPVEAPRKKFLGIF
ncbi:hypothetical protein D9Q98_001400 [Chlorella vulgaris]|uniref:Uncharacterized protein n=1 Tax=Chlorella vulgaris TaxID=3077 RepID=A0A9D4TZZ6_CHLVU|nr:hypothetical protein D9Q98_001400 [Chlorella vulgaris]